MSKFFQKTLVLSGSLALIALIMAAPVVPAQAQGVPAGLLRLDPPKGSNEAAFAQFDDSSAKVRGTHAHTKKIQAQAH
jgi:hypothetical protein